MYTRVCGEGVNVSEGGQLGGFRRKKERVYVVSKRGAKEKKK